MTQVIINGLQNVVRHIRYLILQGLCMCMLQMRICQTEGQQGSLQAQSTVESSSLQVIVTHPSPCATPALSPQTPSGSATATTVRIASYRQNHQSLIALCNMFTDGSHANYIYSESHKVL